MTETKRDLHADLELCERATSGPWFITWYIDEWGRKTNVVVANDGRTYIGEFFQTNDETFIAESREGWPHAIKRAIEAEKRVEELEQKIERYEKFIKKIAEWDTFPANPFRTEAKQALEGKE